MCRPKAEKKRRFRIKIGWTTLRKRSKSMVFAEKIRFSKRKILKFRACGASYTPQKPQNFRACGAATTRQFSNLQAAIALSTRAQNVFCMLLAAET